MSPLRRRIAERLVEAQHTAAILTTFNEVDMSAVMELRARHQDDFVKKHGLKLGFMSFFARACVEALHEFPGVNAELRGSAIIYKRHYDLGARAKDNKLTLEELGGGTFTITNGGIFGSMLSTPIINPPQSAILGLHAINDRPVALNGQVVIRPMMYLALSYDHRLVDGKEAVTFLVKIKQAIEDPARLLLGV